MTVNEGTTGERRTIVGIFDDARTPSALTGLREAGIRPAQVSVVAREAADRATPSDEDEDAEGAAGGAVTGR